MTMTIEEIIAKAKAEGDGLKFKAAPGQEITSEVVFEVLDAWFGFITYEALQGAYFPASYFTKLSTKPLVFELV